MMSDALLIQAHNAGDPNAISTLMQRYQHALMGMLVNRVGSDAEDLYQETWVRVSDNLTQYDERGSFKAWLFQIARRLVIDHHRRRNARIKTVQTSNASDPIQISHHRPDHTLDAVEIHHAYLTALAELDPATAEVVNMRLKEQTPFKVIAEHQGVSINTAIGRMHRGLRQIRETLIEVELIKPERES